MNLFKYLLIAIAVTLILKYNKHRQINNKQLAIFIIGTIFLVFLLDVAFSIENMDENIAITESNNVNDEIENTLQQFNGEVEQINGEEDNYEDIDNGLIEDNLIPKQIFDQYGEPIILPNPYTLTKNNEDTIASGLTYNYDQPKYPLLQHGQFESIYPDFKDILEEMNNRKTTKEFKTPGFYLLNNGKYADDGIPFENVHEMITMSKFNDLYEQANHNIPLSPHTHIGKSRGYLNWDKNYE
jgi:hypothetical protein